MAKQTTKQLKQDKTETQTAQSTELDYEQCVAVFNDLFHRVEDSWHPVQDELLYSEIMKEKRISDGLKIKLLLKKYRDTARDLNLYS